MPRLWYVTPDKSPSFASYVIANSAPEAIDLFQRSVIEEASGDRQRLDVIKIELISGNVVLPRPEVSVQPKGPYR